MFNDIELKSQAQGGVTLQAIFNKVTNPKGAVLLSHNSSGTKDDLVLCEVEKALFAQGYSTLRYNFHYVGKMAGLEAKFEDILLDMEAAYSFLLDNVSVPNVYLIGKSLGGVVSMEYSIQNALKCPLIILGFYQQGVETYVTEQKLKTFRSPLLIIHGEKDQYTTSDSIRTLLGKNRVANDLFVIQGAVHSLEPFTG